ncbi:hypothetical protein Gpo141_00002790 [Globisporangium polare]
MTAPSQFPDGCETHVGNKGEQRSGGQKQRSAILKDHAVLIFDEAMSALDKVLALGGQRSTVIIAHRLSTIQKAGKICVVNDSGTHAELLRASGLYAQLVKAAAL